MPLFPIMLVDGCSYPAFEAMSLLLIFRPLESASAIIDPENDGGCLCLVIAVRECGTSCVWHFQLPITSVQAILNKDRLVVKVASCPVAFLCTEAPVYAADTESLAQ